jgi:hypothetical protein
VRALFAAHLDGLVPSEENRRSLQFLVPGHQQQQLVGLLQQLEAAMAAGSSGSNGGTSGGSSGSKLAAAAEVVGEEGVRALQRGVADVQLSLTSLEEVFLSIAKQVSVPATVLVTGLQQRGRGDLGRTVVWWRADHHATSCVLAQIEAIAVNPQN